MALASVVLFGVWPAVWAARQPANDALRHVRHSSGRLGVFRDGLIVAEISLAVVLLIGSALLGRSLYNLLESGTGAQHANALTMKLSPSANGMGNPSRQAAALGRLLAEMQRAPGVQAAGITSSLPPNVSQMRTSLPVVDASGAEQDLSFEIVAASQGVFDALGIPVLAGRTFADADTSESGPVVILSRKASERFFPDGDAIGRPLKAFAADRRGDAPTVVGLVGDVKFAGLEAPPDGAIYLPYTQRSFTNQYLVVRSSAAAGSPAATIRGSIRAIDPSLAVSDVRSVAELVTAATARPRFQASILVLLATLALALAAVGVYGVVTHVVGQRTRELAVRMALGARPSEVMRMILRKAVLLSAAGATIGVVLSLASARAIEGFLYGVSPLDWPSFAGAAIFAVGLGVSAALWPALRATNVDPAVLLRIG
jgi:predicted permease